MALLRLTKENYTRIVKQTATVLGGGGIVIAPFDTVYGFACSAQNDKAIEKIYQLKERDRSKPIGLACQSIGQTEKIADLTGKDREFILPKTPGPFTFILKIKKPDSVSAYCQHNGTVGIRIPASRFILDIIKQSGLCLAQTSANRTGGGNCSSINEILEQFQQGDIAAVDLIIDAGLIAGGRPSTIIDLTRNQPKEIERK